MQSGATFDGATGYNWVRRPPAVPPVEPQRIVQVPDNPNVEPGNAASFTVEIRFRTKEKFGNIIQKGQSASKGGQWKIENPQGIPTCLFKGSLGRVATGAKTAINDNELAHADLRAHQDARDDVRRRRRAEPPERLDGHDRQRDPDDGRRRRSTATRWRSPATTSPGRSTTSDHQGR